MIPKELQDKIDAFTEKHAEHMKREMEKLEEYFKKVDGIVETLDGDFQKNTIIPLYKETWDVLRKFITDSNRHLLEQQEMIGNRCVQCQDWIEEKLTGKNQAREFQIKEECMERWKKSKLTTGLNFLLGITFLLVPTMSFSRTLGLGWFATIAIPVIALGLIFGLCWLCDKMPHEPDGGDSGF